jgi:hypothetical protein
VISPKTAEMKMHSVSSINAGNVAGRQAWMKARYVYRPQCIMWFEVLKDPIFPDGVNFLSTSNFLSE